MQSRKYSLIEAIANVAVGFGVAIGAQIVVFYLLDIDVEFEENLAIAVFMTGVSLMRSYLLRRLFNWINK